MDRSLSTIDTVWSTLSLSLSSPVAPVRPRSPLLSFTLDSYRHVSSFRETNWKFNLENRVENELEFPTTTFPTRNCYSDGNVGYYEDNRPWFNYAICQPIIFDPRFARLSSRFPRYAPITEINTTRFNCRVRDPLSSF